MTDSSTVPPTRPWTIRASAQLPHATGARRPAHRAPFDTRYVLSWLGEDGQIEDRTQAGPSTQLFTEAVAAFARGSLVMTPDGPVAIEDLLPGDRVVTHRGALTLLWKGSRSIIRTLETMPLFRIPSEQLGPGRPMPDLILGPGARIVSRRSALKTLIGAEAALVPISAMADGETVLRIRPMSTMQVFQLGFAHHATFTVNGVEVDSVHPGALDPALPDETRDLYLSMFPHLDGFDAFGSLSMKRLNGDILHRLTSAA